MKFNLEELQQANGRREKKSSKRRHLANEL